MTKNQANAIMVTSIINARKVPNGIVLKNNLWRKSRKGNLCINFKFEFKSLPVIGRIEGSINHGCTKLERLHYIYLFKGRITLLVWTLLLLSNFIICQISITKPQICVAWLCVAIWKLKFDYQIIYITINQNSHLFSGLAIFFDQFWNIVYICPPHDPEIIRKI